MKKRRVGILLLICAVAAVAVAAFYLLAQQGIGLKCIFNQLTGLQCPGCGNSRAALALLRLDIPGALRHNLLFPLEFFYLFWVLAHMGYAYVQTGRFSYLPKRQWLDITILVVIAGWGVVRNFL